jgi:hypothetical protein
MVAGPRTHHETAAPTHAANAKVEDHSDANPSSALPIHSLSAAGVPTVYGVAGF